MMTVGENGNERYQWLRGRDPVAIARVGLSAADLPILGHVAVGNSRSSQSCHNSSPSHRPTSKVYVLPRMTCRR